MAKESSGEWKLVKVWECNDCKLLIKDGRKVFDHTCSAKDKENELSMLRDIIEHKNLAMDERDKFIESQKNKIDGLESFIKELKGNIEDYNNTIRIRDGIIEKHKTVIDGQKKTIINQEVAIEEHKTVIDGQKKTIINKEMAIEEQKKNQNKVIEKVVYVERNASRTVANKNIDNINVDIWQKDFRIKDSKDNGYREEIEMEIFERGKGKEKIIIKNGKVMKKPDDIIIIGEHTSEGFIIKGIYRN